MNQNALLNLMIHADVGLSVKAICDRAVNGKFFSRSDYPYDHKDLARCIKFLAAAEIDISIMVGVSDEWDALAADWQLLEDTYLREKNTAGYPSFRYPDTNALIKELTQ